MLARILCKNLINCTYLCLLFIQLFLNQHIANSRCSLNHSPEWISADNKQNTFYHFWNCKYLHLVEIITSYLSIYKIALAQPLWSLRFSLNWDFQGKKYLDQSKGIKQNLMGTENFYICFFVIFCQYYQSFFFGWSTGYWVSIQF